MAQIPLNDAGSAVVQEAPSTSDSTITLKKASYERGEYPEHLRQYAADKTGLASAPQKCEGKTGKDFTACLQREADDMGL